MPAEPQERIGVELVVTDSGTPVVRRHTEETRRALGEVERASKRSGAEVAGSMRTAGTATEGLGRTMEKSRASAMALAGGLSQAGGRASMAASAISQLAVTGLNPLGLALAAASVGIGVLVSHFSEGAEGAKKMTAEFRVLYDEILRGSAAIQDARLPGGGATENVIRQRIAQLDALARATETDLGKRREKLAGNLGVTEGMHFGLFTSKDLVGITGLEEKLTALAAERLKLQTELTRMEGKSAAEKEKQLEVDRKALDLWSERLRLGTDVIRARTALARSQFAIGEGNRVAAEELGRFVSETPTVGGDRAFGNESLYPTPTGGTPWGDEFLGVIGDRMSDEDKLRSLIRGDIWESAGARAGDAMAEGISGSLSTAVLTGKFDLADLGRLMGETLVRTFMDALVQAAVGDQLRTAFQSLFMSVGGAIGLGGSAGGTDGLSNPGAYGAPPSYTPQGMVHVDVAPPSVIVASERILSSVPDESLRARVATAQRTYGAPGRRA